MNLSRQRPSGDRRPRKTKNNNEPLESAAQIGKASPGTAPRPGLAHRPDSPDPRQKDTIGLCPKNYEAKARMKYIPASREPAWTGCGNVIANSARRRGFNDESRSPNRRRPIPSVPWFTHSWAGPLFKRRLATLSPASAGLVSLDTRATHGCGLRGTSAADLALFAWHRHNPRCPHGEPWPSVCMTPRSGLPLPRQGRSFVPRQGDD